MDKNNIYGPGDDDYGRNPRLGPNDAIPPEWRIEDIATKWANEHPIPEGLFPPTSCAEERGYSEKVARFMEWLAAHAYRDIRGKYRIFRMEAKTTLNSIHDVYDWWNERIENA